MRIIYATAAALLFHPFIASWLITALPILITAAPAVMTARRWPAKSHPILAFALGATVAALITGHKPAPAPLIKHAPAGPQIPVN